MSDTNVSFAVEDGQANDRQARAKIPTLIHIKEPTVSALVSALIV